jgi:hypothetical protein
MRKSVHFVPSIISKRWNVGQNGNIGIWIGIPIPHLKILVPVESLQL